MSSELISNFSIIISDHYADDPCENSFNENFLPIKIVKD